MVESSLPIKYVMVLDGINNIADVILQMGHVFRTCYGGLG
jgi:hypothetical protein